MPSPGAPVGPGFGSANAGSLFAPASGCVTDEAVPLVPVVVPELPAPAPEEVAPCAKADEAAEANARAKTPPVIRRLTLDGSNFIMLTFNE